LSESIYAFRSIKFKEEKRKMKIAKNKTATIAIAMFLMLSMAASMMLVPTVNAQFGAIPPHTGAWNIPTFAHIFAAINPVGVGQTTHIYMFLTPVFDSALLINNYRFHNYQLTITAPDGKTETKTWDTVQDSTSNQGYSFTPTQVGTYNLTFNFPGQAVKDYPHSPTSNAINDTYLPSTASTTLTVQEEPISTYPHSYPLPSEYWARPIYGENPDWWSISSNWLGSGAPGYGASVGPNQRQYPGDAVGPQTAHIMWTKEVQPGGVVGGNNFEIQGNTYFEGTAYSQRFTNPIIVYGRLYYKEPLSSTGTAGPTVCVDLRTGEEVWRRTDVPALSFALIRDLETPNFHGVLPAILFTSNFARAFDAATGEPLFNVTGIPSGTTVLGPQGEHLRYTFFNNGTTANPGYYLCRWNATLMWNTATMGELNLDTTTTTTWAWQNTTTWVNGSKTITSENVTTRTTVVQANLGKRYDYLNSDTQNQSIPWRNNQAGSPTILAAFYNDILLCRNGSYPELGSSLPYTYFAVNLNASRGAIGNVMWWSTVQPPTGNITTVSFAGADAAAGYFCESYRQTQQFVGFNLRTGAKLWVGDPQPALDYYGSTGPGTLSNVVAYGHIYSSAYAGVLYCYDMATGKVLWTYGNGGAGNSTNSGFQVPGPYPTFINAIGNGIIYTVTTEHTFETPIYKGALTRAINATDGTEIWTLSAATGEFGAESYAIADGFAAFFNSYDQQIYSVGRGPSATTVTAPNLGASFGTPVVIRGTVMDISAGTKQNQQSARFPNGVACASDASMKDWMGYVYQQKPLPTNFAGVQVTIDVLDSNFNYRTIGSATTDASGAYSLTWTPDIAGNYTVIASFAGTNGYWPSYSETAFTVMQAAPTASPYPPQISLPPTEMYIAAAAAAIIVAIAIVGVIVVMMLRKRP
jgi:outer membrane protein assembly factor BamB